MAVQKYVLKDIERTKAVKSLPNCITENAKFSWFLYFYAIYDVHFLFYISHLNHLIIVFSTISHELVH